MGKVPAFQLSRGSHFDLGTQVNTRFCAMNIVPARRRQTDQEKD